MSFFCLLFFLPAQPPAKFLLPEVSIADYGKNCVVIDLDETLVHSSFKVTCRKQTPLRVPRAPTPGAAVPFESGMAETPSVRTRRRENNLQRGADALFQRFPSVNSSWESVSSRGLAEVVTAAEESRSILCHHDSVGMTTRTPSLAARCAEH